MTLGELINVGILLFTFFVLIFAVKTLRIAIKTRLDLFLPIIISIRNNTNHFNPLSDFDIWFHLTNSGHGLALHPKICLVDENNKIIATAQTKAYKEPGLWVVSDHIDHRILEAGAYPYMFAFKKQDFDKLSGNVRLIINYCDIFNRQIKTIYDLCLNKETVNDYQFNIGKCALELP